MGHGERGEARRNRAGAGPVGIRAAGDHADRSLFDLPDEIALRLLGRAIGNVGDEGPVELAKLEALHNALCRARGSARFRRTLAGAVVTLSRTGLSVERAPARRSRAPKRP